MYLIKNINKTYKSKKSRDTKALDDVSLTLDNKGLVFIVGESGSGKSTLLNVLGGLDSIDSGTILFNGKDISTFDEKEMNSYRNTCIGFVFQDFNIFEQFNVRDNILLSLRLKMENDNCNNIEKMLDSLGLGGLGDRKVNELSGGQKQRIAIARALIKEHKVILADEPTGNLDSESSNQIFELLKDISKERLVLVVSHNREAAFNYADRIIEIKDGKIIKDNRKDNNIEQEIINYSQSKLFLKDALLFCLNNIKRKKGRFLLTCILSAFAVLFMVLTFNILIFDSNKYIYETVSDNNEKYVNIYNEECGPDQYGILCNKEPYNEKDIIKLKNNMKHSYGTIYTLMNNGRVLDFEYGEIKTNTGFYNERYTRFVEINGDEVLGNLIGNVPTKSGEVVISEAIADKIVFSGVRLSNGELFKPSSFNELLDSNKLFKLGPNDVKIVGISLENDDEFNDAKKTNIMSYDLEQYFRNDEFKYIDYIYVKGFVDDVELEFSYDELIDSLYIYGKNYIVNNKEYLTEQLTYYNFEGQQVTNKLNYNEIIISIDSIQTMDGFDKDLLNFMNKNPNLTYNDAIIQYTKELVVGNDKFNDAKTHFNMEYQLQDELQTEYFKIVGVVPGNISYVSPELLNSIKDPNRYVNGLRLYIDDMKDLKNIVNDYDILNTVFEIGKKNVIDFKDRESILSVIYIYDFLHNYAAIVCAVFIIFVVLLIYNFIIITIQVSRKDIGVLRALGASSRDVSKIYASEILILNTIGWIVGILLFLLSLMLINTSNIIEPFMKLDIVTLELNSLIFSLVFIFIMSSLLSVISISRVTRIRPIDAILNK